MLLWTVVLLLAPCGGEHVWLHLEVWPSPVFEGDILTLRCRGWKNSTLSQVKFCKDREFFHFPNTKFPLWRGTATMESSGQYSCIGQVTYVQHLGTQTSGTAKVQVQELFPPPLLSAIPSPELPEGSLLTLRCQTKLHPQRSDSQLHFSFHKDGHTLKYRSLHPELQISGAKEEDSGIYGCEAATDNGWVQKQSPWLEIRVQEPVSHPLLDLRPRVAGPAVGDMVELHCEAQRGSPPILYRFYLNEEILGNRSAPQGGAASLLFPVTSEQDGGNYSCEAENSVSRERSEPKKLSVDGPQVLSAPTHPNWLLPWLPLSLLGLMVVAAALLGYFRPWRRAEHHQNEEDEGVTNSVLYKAPKRRKAKPEPTFRKKDTPTIYTEVRGKLQEVTAKGPKVGSRTHKDLLGDYEKVSSS